MSEIYIPQIYSGVNSLRSIPNIYQPNINSGVRFVQVRPLYDIRTWMYVPPITNTPDIPVTQLIGTPIVYMPGCVKVHKENLKDNPNKQLVDNDPKGNVTLCDAGMPYYEPPNYDAGGLSWQTIQVEQEEAEGIDTGDPDPLDTPPPPETPQTPNETKEVECPPLNARRIGDANQAGTERVTGYKLNPEETICITLWEDIPPVEQFIPTAPVISSTAVIATVATTSALLAKPIADLLLRVVKPAIKKGMTAVKKKLGKVDNKPTRSQIISNQYRQSKGLPDLKPSRRMK